jgi:hypothetical protein
MTAQTPTRLDGRRAAVGAALAVLLCTASACGTRIAGSASAPSAIASETSEIGAPTTSISRSATSSTVTSFSEATSSEATITPQKHVDACALLTQKEANALADMELQPAVGAGQEQGADTLCQYTRDPNKDGIAQVSIIVGDGAKKALEIDKDNLGHAFTKVPEIGDEAWQEDDAIFVRKDTTWVEVGLVLLNDPSVNVEPLQQAAKIVVGRL